MLLEVETRNEDRLPPFALRQRAHHRSDAGHVGPLVCHEEDPHLIHSDGHVSTGWPRSIQAAAMLLRAREEECDSRGS